MFETAELSTRLEALRAAGVTVEVAVEPTATYADAVVAQLLAPGVAVYWINTKHSHDYQLIYDGVPSGHDAKAAAIVAKLHLERGASSRPWPVPTPHRRELRMRVAALDWIKARRATGAESVRVSASPPLAGASALAALDRRHITATTWGMKRSLAAELLRTPRHQSAA